MAALIFLHRVLPNADFERLNELSTEIIPVVQDLIVGTQVEDLVLELSLDVWTRWALLLRHFEDDGSHLLIQFMGRLAMASGDTPSRQVASHILRRVQRVTCSTDVLSQFPDESGPLRKFFIAALRYDSAASDTGVYPVTQMTADDYTCITGETEFYELDTTTSDAMRLLDVRYEFYYSMRTLCTSRDFHALGTSLHRLLLRDPRAVDFTAESVQLFADGMAPLDFQLPISSWSDTLQHCADVLRACSRDASGHNHRQAANILQLRSYLQNRDLDAVRDFASKLVKKRDLSELWYWYALSHIVNDEALFDVFETIAHLDAYNFERERAPRQSTSDLRRSTVSSLPR
ncbi:hypothetical protein AURDEDRAFT_125168 [Auricularia subglabra TFB-10046 SS5]|uniref:Uncharacterized protein n=1 Tax=Auricularia subglabra (strain TFB-10046 / SS5) TaxID=717982 RepID=J0DDV2_AURST|nr:hypothetical protein AURDEDRAFT_125168 [Auricularia subglabra TFB-10046 SS5]